MTDTDTLEHGAKAKVLEPLDHAVRPRFQLLLAADPEAVARGVRLALKAPDAPCGGKVEARHITLHPLQAEQHYWSPQLSLTLEETPEGTLVRGLYGPRPTVWTLFVFFYALIGFAALVVGVVGASFLTLGHSGAILWALPVLVLAFLSLYLVAFFGKRTGRDQMITLHHFLEGCFDISIGTEQE